jgi:acetyl esterase/lipase
MFLTALAFAAPPEVTVTRDVVYATADVRLPRAGRKQLLLDLYEPARGPGATRYPGVVLLHPGAWLRGDRRTPPSMADLCRDLARRGFVCASIDYRLQGDDPPGTGASLLDRTIEAAVADSEQAVRWMVANAARHRVDPARIAVGGASAGAGTALLLAYGDRGKSLPIRAALDFWGGMQTSQLSWIERGKPALLIVHGTADEITDFSRAQELADRAKKVGVAWELVPVPGGRHNPPLARYFDRIARFLAAQM